MQTLDLWILLYSSEYPLFYITGASLNFFLNFFLPLSSLFPFYFSPLFSSLFSSLTKYLLSSQYVSSTLLDTMEYAISSKLNIFQVKVLEVL